MQINEEELIISFSHLNITNVSLTVVFVNKLLMDSNVSYADERISWEKWRTSHGNITNSRRLVLNFNFLSRKKRKFILFTSKNSNLPHTCHVDFNSKSIIS